MASATACVLTLSACAAPSGGGGGSKAAPVSAPVVEKVADIAATLPAEIREAGTLVVGVNLPYPPNEFRNDDGTIVGFDVDLLDAVATTLGLTTDYREADFAKIMPMVASGSFDVGMSSVTVTKEREKLVDFVTYFSAGTQWAQRPGSDIDPKNPCGKSIAVKADTIQAKTELPAKNTACVEAGRRPIQVIDYIDQDAVNNAVVIGKVDAMSADSPVTAYAVKQSHGKLEAAGAIFDAAPYGWPVKKDSLLAQSLLQALEHVIKSGTYKAIATKWGLTSGMIEKPAINGATS